MVRAVGDEVGAVGKRRHAAHDTERRQALNLPLGGGSFRVDGHAVVDGVARTVGRTTADQNAKFLSIRVPLGKGNGCSLERIRATALVVVDGSRSVGQRLDGGKGGRVKDPRLVPVLDKDTTTGQDTDERVQVVGVGAVKPIHVERLCSGVGQNLNRGSGGVVGAD